MSNINEKIGKILSTEQMSIIQKVSKEFNTDSDLLLAIGWHETRWGTLGDGKKGMYTGYGSYDSGSDYSYSGFEKQIKGTAYKMKQWGIKPGEVTLSRLQAGNAGLLPSGIYATDKNWSNAIWRIYNEISGGSVIETTSGGSSFGGTGTSRTWEGEIKKEKGIGFGLIFFVVSLLLGVAIVIGGRG